LRPRSSEVGRVREIFNREPVFGMTLLKKSLKTILKSSLLTTLIFKYNFIISYIAQPLLVFYWAALKKKPFY
jgi:hypothetical protein